MNKQFDLLIDTKRTNYNNVRGLKQGDNNSVLNITLVQDSVPLDLTDCSIRINYKRTDDKVFLQMADIVNAIEGQVKVNVLTKVLEKSGIHEADLSIFDKDNRKITSITFTMFVEASVYTNDYLENEDLDIIQDIYVKENERIANEKIRVENENIRKSNEEIRKTSENDRIEAETTRINDENIRKTNEEKRVKNEDVRQANEGVRVKNETNRVNEFETIKSDYNTYKNVMIAESNVANLQEQINKHEGLLKENATKEVTLKDGVEHLTGGVDGISYINSIGGNSLYKKKDGTYTDVWEENIELESVKDNVEVISCGKNLCDNKLQLKEINSDTGQENEKNKNIITTVNYFEIPIGKDFYVKLYYKGSVLNGQITGRWYDENKNYIGVMDITNPRNRPSDNAVYLRLRFLKGDAINDIENYKFMLSYDDVPYEPYKESQTTIQLKEPLRSLPNGVKDEIKDGTLVRRVGKIVLDGSEEWTEYRKDADTSRMYIHLNDDVKVTSTKMTDLLPSLSYDIYAKDEEGLYITTKKVLQCRISNSKLTAPDAVGFKKWLSENPTTVLYELEEPTIEKIETIKPLKCWQDGSLIINSNINPIVNFKYPTNLNSRLSSVEENTLNNSNFVKEQNAINLQFDFRITALENKEELV